LTVQGGTFVFPLQASSDRDGCGRGWSSRGPCGCEAAGARVDTGLVEGGTAIPVFVVLTPRDTRVLIDKLNGSMGLIVSLLYGIGIRLLDELRLRIKDVEFERLEIVVRDAKGGKDRVTMLPENLVLLLQDQMAQAKQLHDDDLVEGLCKV